MNMYIFDQTKFLHPKSILTASALGLLMLGALNGCQTTSSLPYPIPNTSKSLSTATGQSTEDKQPSITHQNTQINQTQPVPHQTEPVSHQTEPVTYSSTTLPENGDYTGSDNDGYNGDSKDNDPDLKNPIDQPETSDSSVSISPTADAPIMQNNDSPSVTSNSEPHSSNTKTNASPVRPAPVTILTPPKPDARTTQQQLLEQARQNSQQGGRRTNASNTTPQDGNNIPAFQKLMDTGVSQLRQGQISAAESTFTRAQRLAPQSSTVYFYLGQVALKQNQPLKAEAMARRGLVVATTPSRKRALWQIILKSAQARGNVLVINEANAALAK